MRTLMNDFHSVDSELMAWAYLIITLLIGVLWGFAANYLFFYIKDKENE